MIVLFAVTVHMMNSFTFLGTVEVVVIQAFDAQNIDGPPIGSWFGATGTLPGTTALIACDGGLQPNTIYNFHSPGITGEPQFTFLINNLQPPVDLVFR